MKNAICFISSLKWNKNVQMIALFTIGFSIIKRYNEKRIGNEIGTLGVSYGE